MAKCCKVCRIPSDKVDKQGRCRSCAVALAATNAGMHYGERALTMGKARILGQNRPFVPNRYADMRRRPATTLARFERMHIQAEERKAKQEMEDNKK